MPLIGAAVGAAVARLSRRIDPYRMAATVRAHGGAVLHAALSGDVAGAMPAAVVTRAPTKVQAHVAGYADQLSL